MKWQALYKQASHVQKGLKTSIMWYKRQNIAPKGNLIPQNAYTITLCCLGIPKNPILQHKLDFFYFPSVATLRHWKKETKSYGSKFTVVRRLLILRCIYALIYIVFFINFSFKSQWRMSKYCATLGHCKNYKKNTLRIQFKSFELAHCFTLQICTISFIFLLKMKNQLKLKI